MSKKNPLDDKFNVQEEKLIDEESTIVEIPDDPEERNLDLVIDYALKAYKELSEIIEYIEPSHRLKYYEMAERYLNQAKDARAKKEKLQIDREKLQKRPTSSSQGESDDGDGKDQEEGKVSRKELQEKLRAVK